MDIQTNLQFVQDLLHSWTDRTANPDPARLDVYTTPEKLVEAVQAIFAAGGWHLSAITGLDVSHEDAPGGAIEVLYHFCKGPAILTLRVNLPYDLPEVPSICGVIPSATMYERELIEMFGVIVVDTPDHSRLLLPDDWPDYVYPLRKSFKGLDQE